MTTPLRLYSCGSRVEPELCPPRLSKSSQTLVWNLKAYFLTTVPVRRIILTTSHRLSAVSQPALARCSSRDLRISVDEPAAWQRMAVCSASWALAERDTAVWQRSSLFGCSSAAGTQSDIHRVKVDGGVDGGVGGGGSRGLSLCKMHCWEAQVERWAC